MTENLKQEDGKFHCLKPKCLHSWYPRVPGAKPQVCPECKSRSWDRPNKVLPLKEKPQAADNQTNQTSNG